MPKKILVPDNNPEARVDAPSGLVDQVAKKSPPVCPVCKAKFSHNLERQCCSKCGLPDEIASMDHRMIARWAKRQGFVKPVGASKQKGRVKHGRVGVRR